MSIEQAETREILAECTGKLASFFDDEETLSDALQGEFNTQSIPVTICGLVQGRETNPNPLTIEIEVDSAWMDQQTDSLARIKDVMNGCLDKLKINNHPAPTVATLQHVI